MKRAERLEGIKEEALIRNIHERVVENLVYALSLSNETLRSINKWVRSQPPSLIIDPDKPDREEKLRSVANSELKIPYLELATSLTVIGMYACSPSREKAANFVLRLKDTFELSPDEVEKLSILLKEVNFDQDEIDLMLTGRALSESFIPVIQDVDIIWDLRIISEHRPTPRIPLDESIDKHVEGLKKLEGCIPVAMVNLEIRDNLRNKSNIVFQLPVNFYRRFLKTMQEGLTQLDVINTKLPKLNDVLNQDEKNS